MTLFHQLNVPVMMKTSLTVNPVQVSQVSLVLLAFLLHLQKTMHTYIDMCVNVYIYNHICIYMCVYMCIYILMYMHTVYKIKNIQAKHRIPWTWQQQKIIIIFYYCLVNIKLFA